MYIISKEKDYYDGVVNSMGIDKTIVYERKSKTIESNENDFPNEFKRDRFDYNPNNKPFSWLKSFELKNDSPYDEHRPFIIGFCGKIYVGWELIKMECNTLNVDEIKIVYDYDEMLKHFKNHIIFNYNIVDLYKNIINKDVMNIFRRYNTPIFLYHHKGGRRIEFTINPHLKSYEFYRIFDSFTAFQEIQMFISGVLGVNENNTIDISNDDKLQQYGYDRWSFRREKHPRKSKE